MSFSALEILEEFVAVAQLGRHHERAVRWDSWHWFAEVGFRKARPVYIVKPAVAAAVTCPSCGAPCEIREGHHRRVHLGPPTRCTRRIAA